MLKSIEIQSMYLHQMIDLNLVGFKNCFNKNIKLSRVVVSLSISREVVDKYIIGIGEPMWVSTKWNKF
jgi:hypothetical protein